MVKLGSKKVKVEIIDLAILDVVLVQRRLIGQKVGIWARKKTLKCPFL